MLKVRDVFRNNMHALTEETANIGIPDVKEYGLLVLDHFSETDGVQSQSCPYFLMPFYGQSLKSYLAKFDGYYKQEQILSISQQIISILKFIHSGRRAYNGIRPENVRIDIQENGEPKVSLIDFSETTKYVDDMGHIGNDQIESDIQLLPYDFAFCSL